MELSGRFALCILIGLWVGIADGAASAQEGQLRFVSGPFNGYGSLIAQTDVREFGCSDCAPTMRILGTPDLDGDGAPEVILTMESFNKQDKATNIPLPIFIFRIDGSPYKGIDQLPMRVHPREAVIADFNGDGRDDVFISAHGMDRKPFPGEQNVLLLSQKGGRHMDVSLTHLPQMEDMSHGAGAGDIDGDGDADIVVVTNGGGGKAGVSNYFLINDGSGVMTFSKGSNHLPSGAPRKDDFFLTARLVDVNGDRKNDLLLAGEGYNGSPSLLLIGDGKGQFGKPTKLPRSPFGKRTFTTDIDVQDLNSDGRSDLILLNTGQLDGRAFRGMHIQLLIQDSDGSFVDQSEDRIWDQSSAARSDVSLAHNINLADLDRDGDLDLVVQSLNPAWKERAGDIPPHVGLNDGSGSFAPVDPTWLATSGYTYRQLMPVRVRGSWKILGLSLNGINEADGFWAVGHKLYLFQ